MSTSLSLSGMSSARGSASDVNRRCGRGGQGSATQERRNARPTRRSSADSDEDSQVVRRGRAALAWLAPARCRARAGARSWCSRGPPRTRTPRSRPQSPRPGAGRFHAWVPRSPRLQARPRRRPSEAGLPPTKGQEVLELVAVRPGNCLWAVPPGPELRCSDGTGHRVESGDDPAWCLCQATTATCNDTDA